MYVVIMRGLPGSGKTRFARMLLDSGSFRPAEHVSADHYFERRGCFDASKLGEAHTECQINARLALGAGRSIIVDNTHVTRREWQPYVDVAGEFSATVVFVDLFDGGCTDEQLTTRNVHNTPLETIRRRRSVWQTHDLR